MKSLLKDKNIGKEFAVRFDLYFGSLGQPGFFLPKGTMVMARKYDEHGWAICTMMSLVPYRTFRIAPDDLVMFYGTKGEAQWKKSRGIK